MLTFIACGVLVFVIASAATLGYFAMYMYIIATMYGVHTPCASYSELS